MIIVNSPMRSVFYPLCVISSFYKCSLIIPCARVSMKIAIFKLWNHCRIIRPYDFCRSMQWTVFEISNYSLQLLCSIVAFCSNLMLFVLSVAKCCISFTSFLLLYLSIITVSQVFDCNIYRFLWYWLLEIPSFGIVKPAHWHQLKLWHLLKVNMLIMLVAPT